MDQPAGTRKDAVLSADFELERELAGLTLNSPAGAMQPTVRAQHAASDADLLGGAVNSKDQTDRGSLDTDQSVVMAAAASEIADAEPLRQDIEPDRSSQLTSPVLAPLVSRASAAPQAETPPGALCCQDREVTVGYVYDTLMERHRPPGGACRVDITSEAQSYRFQLYQYSTELSRISPYTVGQAGEL